MPKKGIKVWVLGESYISRLEVYEGRNGTTTENGLGARVVQDLTCDFKHRWHRCLFDNYFTSKRLPCDLLEVGIYGCVKCRRDRNPKELKKPKGMFVFNNAF